jgi:D-alanyl-lipoteichoic acid acyltransferase DltB (MBOAT superfamily)
MVTRLLGSGLELAIPHWVLPLGISFYMFEAISYIVDVIRKRERVHGFWDFQLFISFFPKLIAGPILRAKEFLPQIERGNLRPTISGAREGLWLLASGLFLKLVMANTLAPQVDEAFARSASSLGPMDVWLMAVAFGLQIYFDFSSYTRMAIGSAKLCGIQLVENFNYPYSATNPVDFWNRWHMSLSRWIRDYLFFPLAGNRPTLGSMLRAALVAMTLCGLWHGAGWTFVLWGFYHGLLICGTHVVRFEREPKSVSSRTPRSAASRIPSFLTTPLATIATFALVSLGWILFRSYDNVTQAFTLLSTALRPWQAHSRAFGGTFYAETAGMLVLVWMAPTATRIWERLSAYAAIPEQASADGLPAEAAAEVVPARTVVLQIAFGTIEGIAIGLMLTLCLVFFYGQTQFIYFQF